MNSRPAGEDADEAAEGKVKAQGLSGAAYVSELPDGGGGLGLPVVWAVPHPQVGLPLRDLSTKLSHRVEADLLLRRVFKVLEWRTGLTHTHTQLPLPP